jgi:hypothetical protein
MPPAPTTRADASRALHKTNQGYALVRSAKRALRTRVRKHAEANEGGKVKTAYRRLMQAEGQLLVRIRALAALVRSTGVVRESAATSSQS